MIQTMSEVFRAGLIMGGGVGALVWMVGTSIALLFDMVRG